MKRIRGQFLGCLAVRFREQQRHTLAAGLVLETVDVIFRGKLRRRSREVTEQVPHRIVVLRVRESPNHRRRTRFNGRVQRRILRRPLGQSRHVPNPCEQYFFLFACLENALAA